MALLPSALYVGLLLLIILSLDIQAGRRKKKLPIATIINPTEEFKLKSLEGGLVTIRRMTWGEKLKRQAMMTKFHMNLNSKKSEDSRAEIDILSEQVSMWEFMNLIVDHNLEHQDATGTVRKLNFKNAADVALLDPIIGEEIQMRIDELNAFEDSEEIKN
jgi:hypothetical protein